jgi:hypothetical protein
MLYYSSIHSHLIYGIHIWSCTADSNLKPLILKQKMAIRTLCDAAYNAHTEPLFKKSAILPLPYLCEYFKVQFMQKFTQGFLPSSLNDVWVTNAIRRADQDHVELCNNSDLIFHLLASLPLNVSLLLASQKFGRTFLMNK